MIPIFNLGPVSINMQLLILFAGLWIGVSFSEKYAPLRGIRGRYIENLIFISLIAGFVGARLGYVMQYFSIFLQNPLAIFSIKPVMFNPEAGLLVGCISGFIYAQKKAMNFWPVLDSLTPGLAVFGIALGFSHLATGDAYGIPTTLPWGIELWGEVRHPTQLYEIFAAIFITFMIWPKKPQRALKEKSELLEGLTGLRFFIFYAGTKIVIETFRANSALLAGNIRAAQVLWWIVMAVCLIQMNKIIRRNSQED